MFNAVADDAVDVGIEVDNDDDARNEGNGHDLEDADKGEVEDVDYQVNIAMTATYMIFGLSLFWMVFHLVQVTVGNIIIV